MARECCRACDGSKIRRTVDKENVFKVTETVCAKCGGSGREPGPAKEGKRGFRRTPKSEDDDNDLNAAADKFLASRGYNRNGR